MNSGSGSGKDYSGLFRNLKTEVLDYDVLELVDFDLQAYYFAMAKVEYSDIYKFKALKKIRGLITADMSK